jgi:hypothetical protein
MGILTNINNQFTVNSTGAIRFNDAYTFPTADGTANYILKTNGGGQISWVPDGGGGVTGSGSNGQVTFWTGTSSVSGDNDFFWDNTNKRLGIGMITPACVLNIEDSISTTYSPTGYAGTIANSMLYLNNTHGGSDTASLINFRTGSGDGLVGFVEAGGTNDADFIIQTDGGSNGIERFRILNNGYVGIGTALPPTLLSNTATRIGNADGLTTHLSGLNWGVNGQGYIAAFSNLATAAAQHNAGLLVELAGTDSTDKILDLESGGVNKIRVTGSGNLLMGNTVVNPASGFADQTGIGLKYSTTVPEIQVSSDSTAMQLGRTSTGGAGQILAMRAASVTVHSFNTDGVSLGTVVDIDQSSGVTILQLINRDTTLVDAGEIQNQIRFRGLYYSGSGSLLVESQIASGHELADGNGGSFLNFSTQTGGSAAVEQMRIDSVGNVGIGTTDPNVKLRIAGTQGNPATSGSTSTGFLSLYGTGSSHGLMMGVQNVSPFGSWIQAQDKSNHATNYNLLLNPNGGNVGIGLTNPSSTLTIESEAGKGTIELFAANAATTTNKIIFSEAILGDESFFIEHDGAGAGAANLLKIHGDGSGGTAGGITIQRDGNVGMGTDSPSTPLMVNRASNSNEPGIYYDVTGGGSGSVGIGSTAAFGPFIVGNTLPNGNVRGAYSASRMLFNGAGFSFQTSDETSGARVWDNRMKIEIGGNVGIGTTSFAPTVNLQLKMGNMGSGAVGEIFDAVDNVDNSRIIICGGGGGSPQFSMRHYSAAYGFDIWMDVTSTWDTYFDVRQSTSGFRWRNNTNSAGGEVDLMTLDGNAGAGTLTVKGDIVAYGSPSDKRLKENIKPIESALDKAMKLQGVTFNWKESDSILEIKEDIGFIAQDVQKVIPELVRENEDGMLSLRHQGITPILLEAIKELKAEIEELKQKPCNCNNCNCK